MMSDDVSCFSHLKQKEEILPALDQILIGLSNIYILFLELFFIFNYAVVIKTSPINLLF